MFCVFFLLYELRSMRSQTYLPAIPLRSYIEKYEVVEQNSLSVYKVLPGLNMVMGFQYRGAISKIENGTEEQLSTAGVTGLADRFKMFSAISPVGSVLVYLNTTGLAAFCRIPANEVFNKSVPLDHFFFRKQSEKFVNACMKPVVMKSASTC